MITLVTGGARSGKSKRAEALITECQGEKLYIATAIPYDDEMKDRIKKHQQSRPSNWMTYEGFRDLHNVLGKEGRNYGAILLDCVTIWVTNLLFDIMGDRDFDRLTEEELKEMEASIMDQVTKFVEAMHKLDESTGSLINMVLVTNELGMGLVPESKLSRVFRDIQGRVNQYLGSHSHAVELVVCGIPMKIK